MALHTTHIYYPGAHTPSLDKHLNHPPPLTGIQPVTPFAISVDIRLDPGGKSKETGIDAMSGSTNSSPPVTSIAFILSPQSPPSSPKLSAKRKPQVEPILSNSITKFHPHTNRVQKTHVERPFGQRIYAQQLFGSRPYVSQPYCEQSYKFWTILDVSPGKDFLKDCSACTGGKKYTERYAAVEHLRRIHLSRAKDGTEKEYVAKIPINDWIQAVEVMNPKLDQNQQWVRNAARVAHFIFG